MTPIWRPRLGTRKGAAIRTLRTCRDWCPAPPCGTAVSTTSIDCGAGILEFSDKPVFLAVARRRVVFAPRRPVQPYGEVWPSVKGQRLGAGFTRALLDARRVSRRIDPSILIGHGIGLRTYRTASRANVADRAYGHRRRLFHGRARFFHHLDLLPQMAASFQVSPPQMSAAITSYLISLRDLHSDQRLDRRPFRGALRVLLLRSPSSPWARCCVDYRRHCRPS